MKCFNKLKADYAVLLSFISCMFFMGSCNIAYQYDIESGTEDDTADSTNVTIVTGEGIDVSMYESARVFPGLVDTLVDNTVNTLLALDLSKRYIPAYDLDVQQVPRPIYSTGLYAGAGELITITINGYHRFSFRRFDGYFSLLAFAGSYYFEATVPGKKHDS